MMTILNEIDKSTPSKTITREHTNPVGALQAIVPCDTNVAFAKRNFCALTLARSLRILFKFKPLLTLDSMDIIVKLFKGSCWIEDLK